MSSPPFDVAKAHRWFAVECNNLSWDLVESKQRTPEQTQQMLHAAHAALLHWHEVGAAVNQLRAYTLLTSAYARAGIGSEAIKYADESLKMLETMTDHTSWDTAAAYGSAAGAYAATGRSAEARQFYDKAMAIKIEPDDRAVFDKLFPRPA
jgi:tetratricopeptide (TPR) repeat protein